MLLLHSVEVEYWVEEKPINVTNSLKLQSTVKAFSWLVQGLLPSLRVLKHLESWRYLLGVLDTQWACSSTSC